MPVAGVDVGSVAAKAIVLDEDKKIVLGRAVLPTGWNSREAGEQVLQAAWDPLHDVWPGGRVCQTPQPPHRRLSVGPSN